jgi:hypothetical protein
LAVSHHKATKVRNKPAYSNRSQEERDLSLRLEKEIVHVTNHQLPLAGFRALVGM